MAEKRRRGYRPSPFWLAAGLATCTVCLSSSSFYANGFIMPPPIHSRDPGARIWESTSPTALQRRPVGPDISWAGIGISSTRQPRHPQAATNSQDNSGATVKRPWTANIVSWIASRIISKYTVAVAGLGIDVNARSNRDVIAGNLPIVKAKFDQVVLDSLQITGGGNMVITGLDIRMITLILARRMNVLRRPFEIFCDYVLTKQDIMASKLIRDLIQLLVNTILKAIFPNTPTQGLIDVQIESVQIMNGKLAINFNADVAANVYGSTPSFTLLTGIGLSGEGHVIYLDKPELLLNPKSKVPVKVPLGTIRVFDVDIGDNARIERIQIDDQVGVRITARTLITPAPPFQVSDVGKRAAFLCDLGAFLSSFWGFTHYPDMSAEV